MKKTNPSQIEEIRSTLIQLRRDPETRRKFPREVWDSIIRLTKTYSIQELCHQLQLTPTYLKKKLHEPKKQTLEFREISMPTGLQPVSDAVTIELSMPSGLKAKIQGPISCMNNLFKLFER